MHEDNSAKLNDIDQAFHHQLLVTKSLSISITQSDVARARSNTMNRSNVGFRDQFLFGTLEMPQIAIAISSRQPFLRRTDVKSQPLTSQVQNVLVLRIWWRINTFPNL